MKVIMGGLCQVWFGLVWFGLAGSESEFCTSSILWVITKSSQGRYRAARAAKNIARMANTVQCHSLFSGHYDCDVFMFSIIVGNVNNLTTSLGLLRGVIKSQNMIFKQ